MAQPEQKFHADDLGGGGGGVTEMVKKTFDLDKVIDCEQFLSQRLIDCFGMFDYLLDKGNS
jgi:hypothetical protein